MHRVVALVVPDVIMIDLAIPAEIFGREVERGHSFAVCTEHPVAVSSTSGFEVRINQVVSVCVGAFALAAAGLLDGRSATTHWEFADELATRFPAVRVLPEVRYVDEGEVLASAGIAAGIDLCLYMVPEDGPGLAATRTWAIQEMHRPLTVADLARQAGCSSRTFARRFVAEVGITPLRWLTEERLDEARRPLEATEIPVEEVAWRCVLGTAANLRLHLARHEATTPTAYRRAFRISGTSGTDLRRPVATA